MEMDVTSKTPGDGVGSNGSRATGAGDGIERETEALIVAVVAVDTGGLVWFGLV